MIKEMSTKRLKSSVVLTGSAEWLFLASVVCDMLMTVVSLPSMKDQQTPTGGQTIINGNIDLCNKMKQF